MSKENFGNTESKDLSSKLEKFTTQELLARKKDESQLKNEINSKNGEKTNGLQESKETQGEITEMIEGTHYEIKNGVFKLKIDAEKLQDVTFLKIDGKGLKNIDSIAKIKNLELLSLVNNNISDISALSNLGELESLYLENNQITDISALSNLIKLKSLYLENNQITDISALSNLIKLKSLQLENNQITDISALSNLGELESLYLENNQITDISALSGLVNLHFLILSKNNISNILPLKNLKKIAWLFLGNQGIPGLQENLYKSQVSGLISGFPDLTILKLGHNMRDMKMLLKLSQPTLKTFDLLFSNPTSFPSQKK